MTERGRERKKKKPLPRKRMKKRVPIIPKKGKVLTETGKP